MIMREEWTPVSEFPDYAVSNEGRVMRVVADWQGKGLNRLMAGTLDREGYRRVLLTNTTAKRPVKISRLVCVAFHGEPAAGMHAAHRNGDKENNRADNLYWATPKQNAIDKVAHGTSPQGARNGRAKLSEIDAAEIRTDYRAQPEIAADYGVSQCAISNVKLRKTWGHVA